MVVVVISINISHSSRSREQKQTGIISCSFIYIAGCFCRSSQQSSIGAFGNHRKVVSVAFGEHDNGGDLSYSDVGNIVVVVDDD